MSKNCKTKHNSLVSDALCKTAVVGGGASGNRRGAGMTSRSL
jgi:hypothetical protein